MNDLPGDVASTPEENTHRLPVSVHHVRTAAQARVLLLNPACYQARPYENIHRHKLRYQHNKC